MRGSVKVLITTPIALIIWRIIWLYQHHTWDYFKGAMLTPMFIFILAATLIDAGGYDRDSVYDDVWIQDASNWRKYNPMFWVFRTLRYVMMWLAMGIYWTFTKLIIPALDYLFD